MTDGYRTFERAKAKRPRCRKCGEVVYSNDQALLQARLCPRHHREALATAPVIADGTGSTPGCRCDEDGRCCEFPCWQRVGLTDQPCCPGCPPLDAPAPPPVATVTAIRPTPGPHA